MSLLITRIASLASATSRTQRKDGPFAATREWLITFFMTAKAEQLGSTSPSTLRRQFTSFPPARPFGLNRRRSYLVKRPTSVVVVVRLFMKSVTVLFKVIMV